MMDGINLVNKNGCDCLDCIKDTVYSKHTARAVSMWEQSDSLEGSPDQFINGLLVARENVYLLDRPAGNVVKTIKPGDKVGVIYSYIVNGGNVYWQLDNGKFVKHSKSIFDDIALSNSLKAFQASKDAKINDAAKKRMDENENPLYRTGKFLESLISFDTMITIIVGIIVMIIGSMLLKIFK